MKKCTTCKIPKDLDLFHNRKSNLDGKKNICKQCAKNSYLKRKPLLLELAHKRYELKKASILAYGQEHRRKNSKRYTELARLRAARYRAESLHFRIKHNITSQLGLALKKQNCTKKSRVVKLLGVEISEFKEYLQSKFLEGMTWENYGQWHIDHKIPSSWFDLKTQESQERCFHYTNLQPLWAADNIRKSNRYAD